MAGPLQPRAVGAAIDFVSEKIHDFTDVADKYDATLKAALKELGNIKVEGVEPPPPLKVPEFAPMGVELGEIPDLVVGTPVLPGFPTMDGVDALLSGLDVPEMEAFPPAPVMIPLSLPDAPHAIKVTPPVRPDFDTTVTLPDAPVVTLPEMEGLLEIKVPDFVFPILPDFDGVPPSADGITVPDVFVNWKEPVYASELLEELTGQVQGMMAGGTGLPPPVEDALFARARERLSAETSRAVLEAHDTWAGRGFSMPPGMLVKAVEVARQEGRLKAAELSRDILVEAAKWQIESIRFAVQQGIALEGLTMNLFENTAKRLFEVARFQAESQISVFNARIGLFNAQTAAFNTLAQVYKTRLDGALAKLTAYKTAIEAQGLIGQINSQKVEVYKARLQGITANVEVYKTLMQGAQIKAEAIQSQINAYKADVQAFAEQISAEKVRFDAYESQVKAETAKAGMLDAQARAYASTIQGLAAKAEIGAKGAQLKMDAARVRVQKYLADVDGYKARVDAALKEVGLTTEVFRSRVEAWRARTGAVTTLAEAGIRNTEMVTRTNIAYSEMQIKEYESKMQKAIQTAQIALEAAKAMGMYSAQLAAGAMSAMHVSANVSGSGSESLGHSTSNSYSETKSESESTNHNYSY